MTCTLPKRWNFLRACQHGLATFAHPFEETQCNWSTGEMQWLSCLSDDCPQSLPLWNRPERESDADSPKSRTHLCREEHAKDRTCAFSCGRVWFHFNPSVISVSYTQREVAMVDLPHGWPWGSSSSLLGFHPSSNFNCDPIGSFLGAMVSVEGIPVARLILYFSQIPL